MVGIRLVKLRKIAALSDKPATWFYPAPKGAWPPTTPGYPA
jgi:hypothetical protein